VRAVVFAGTVRRLSGGGSAAPPAAAAGASGSAGGGRGGGGSGANAGASVAAMMFLAHQPTRVLALSKYESVSCCINFSAALETDGTAISCGYSAVSLAPAQHFTGDCTTGVSLSVPELDAGMAAVRFAIMGRWEVLCPNTATVQIAFKKTGAITITIYSVEMEDGLVGVLPGGCCYPSLHIESHNFCPFEVERQSCSGTALFAGPVVMLAYGKAPDVLHKPAIMFTPSCDAAYAFGSEKSSCMRDTRAPTRSWAASRTSCACCFCSPSRPSAVSLAQALQHVKRASRPAPRYYDSLDLLSMQVRGAALHRIGRGAGRHSLQYIPAPPTNAHIEGGGRSLDAKHERRSNISDVVHPVHPR
jgi:hypothetical protein